MSVCWGHRLHGWGRSRARICPFLSDVSTTGSHGDSLIIWTSLNSTLTYGDLMGGAKKKGNFVQHKGKAHVGFSWLKKIWVQYLRDRTGSFCELDTAYGKTQQCCPTPLEIQHMENLRSLSPPTMWISSPGRPQVREVGLFWENLWEFGHPNIGNDMEEMGISLPCFQRTWKSKSNQQPLDDSLVRPLPKALPVVLTCLDRFPVYARCKRVSAPILGFLVNCDLTSGLLKVNERVERVQ